MTSIFHSSHSSRQPGEHETPGPSSKRPTLSAEPMPDHALGNLELQGLQRSGMLRAKLQLSGANDPEERSADAIAEHVMRSTGGSCCATCESGGSCDSDKVHRSAQASSAAVPSLSEPDQKQVRSLTSGGEQLPADLRSFYEPRMGYDLANVRIHNDAGAHDAAGTIQARAFTVGNHISFGAGHWSPHSSEGRRLIAHELAHVRQPREKLRRQPAQPGSAIPAPVPPFVPAPGQLGTETQRVTDSSGVISATIARSDRESFIEPNLNLTFDSKHCTLTTGQDVAFQPADGPLQLLEADFEAIVQRFLTAANDYLDSWFAIRITGQGCGASCADRQMPIRVRLNRVAPSGTGGGGPPVITIGKPPPGIDRANSRNLYDTADDWTLRHEAGHVALGAADEYGEAGVPRRSGSNVEERDYSLMADQNAYGRRSLLHPRHFSHVITWFEREYPQCQIELTELKRPRPLDFELQLGLGAASMGGSYGIAASAGVAVGVPLDRLRNWAVTVGPHAHVLFTVGEVQRLAYLGGLRVGLERRFTPSAGGFKLGGYTEAGYGSFELSSFAANTPQKQSQRSAYGIAGLQAGYGFQDVISLGVDFSVGSPLSGRAVPPFTSSAQPQALTGWWQLGLAAALRF